MTRVLPRRTPLAAHLLPRSLFYGWYVAIACAVFSFVGGGVGYYGLAVFLQPLQSEHAWSNTAVSGATGLYFSIWGVTAALVGPAIDRRGPISFMIIGITFCAIFAVLIGFVQSLWQLYAVYAAFGIASGAATSVTTYAVITRWFVRRRAFAVAISSTGVSLGGIVLSPVISKLIDIGGLRLAAPVMGLLVAVVALPAILLVVAWDPAQMGLSPDGVTGQSDLPSGNPLLAEDVQLRPWTTREACATIAFWSILIAFLLGSTAQNGFLFQEISFLDGRLGSRQAAAFALSVTAFGALAARLVVGRFADVLDKRTVTAVLFLIRGTAILLIAYTGNVPLTWILAFLFGATIGNLYMMQTLLVGEIFGMISFGAILGVITFVGEVGSGAGPFGVGFLYDLTGGYDIPLTVAAGLIYAAACIILFARPSRAGRSAGPTSGSLVATAGTE